MKEAIIFGFMNPAKMESTVISKSISSTARQSLLEKGYGVAGYKIMLPKVYIPGGAIVQFLSFYPC